MANNSYWIATTQKQFCQTPALHIPDFEPMTDNLLSPAIVNIINGSEYIRPLAAENTLDEKGSSFLSEITQFQSEVSSTISTPTISYPLDLICGVCGAPAHGYNFDQITCESCKAFFRRNALRHMPDLKCRFSGLCPITAKTRRQCTYCRLKKCFAIKMRKEWIRTEEEQEMRRLKNLNKQQRKMGKFMEINTAPTFSIAVRRKKQLSSAPTPSPEQRAIAVQPFVPFKKMIYSMNFLDLNLNSNLNLNETDWSLLNNIMNAYEIVATNTDCSYINKYTSSTSLTQFINDESIMHESLIYFFKQIREFQQVEIDDQMLLIKCNLNGLIHLHRILLENFRENSQIGRHMTKWISPEFHMQMSRSRLPFDRFMEHPLVIQLALIMLVFSTTLFIPRGKSSAGQLGNQRLLYQSQNVYATLLWRYLNLVFGEREAIRSIQIIVMQILRYQLLMDQFDDVIRNQNDINSCHPLMLSVFRLT